MKKTTLVTGATSGIGKATAIRLANEGYNLVICGRRMNLLNELNNQLSDLTQIHCLSFDVSIKEEVFEAINSLPEAFKSIDVLVNNAGNAHGLSSFQDGDTDDWEAMIDINVKGLLYVSKAVIEGMISRKSGHIINIGSIAGKEVYANGNVYCASKFAVDALNQGMRIDLNKHGIKVGAIHPGLVETNFSNVRFKGDTTKADQVYKGYKALHPEDIADVIHFMISRPYHVNIADLLILPAAQATSTMVNKTT
jgi:3-hydroxy acid dehydrogenase/malonic semialdehyde reductase